MSTNKISGAVQSTVQTGASPDVELGGTRDASKMEDQQQLESGFVEQQLAHDADPSFSEPAWNQFISNVKGSTGLNLDPETVAAARSELRQKADQSQTTGESKASLPAGTTLQFADGSEITLKEAKQVMLSALPAGTMAGQKGDPSSFRPAASLAGDGVTTAGAVGSSDASGAAGDPTSASSPGSSGSSMGGAAGASTSASSSGSSGSSIDGAAGASTSALSPRSSDSSVGGAAGSSTSPASAGTPGGTGPAGLLGDAKGLTDFVKQSQPKLGQAIQKDFDQINKDPAHADKGGLAGSPVDRYLHGLHAAAVAQNGGPLSDAQQKTFEAGARAALKGAGVSDDVAAKGIEKLDGPSEKSSKEANTKFGDADATTQNYGDAKSIGDLGARGKAGILDTSFDANKKFANVSKSKSEGDAVKYIAALNNSAVQEHGGNLQPDQLANLKGAAQTALRGAGVSDDVINKALATVFH